jgi:hypothetical protein
MSDPTAPGYEPQAVEPAAPAPADAPRHGALARLWLVFMSPGEVFADIVRKPTWALCLVVLLLVAVGSQLVALPHVDMAATIQQRMAAQGQELSDAQMDQILERADKFAYFAVAGVVVVLPLVMLLLGAVYFLGLKMAGSEADYLQTFSAVLHAYWPAGFTKAVLFGVIVQRVGKLSQEGLEGLLKSNVGAFLGSDAPHWLKSVGTTLDVFNVWTVVLLVLGLATVGKMSRGKAAVAAIVPWILFMAGKAVFAIVMH